MGVELNFGYFAIEIIHYEFPNYSYTSHRAFWY